MDTPHVVVNLIMGREGGLCQDAANLAQQPARTIPTGKTTNPKLRDEKW